MNDTKNDILASVIGKYVVASKDLYPLSSESLVIFFYNLCKIKITEQELIDCFIRFGYQPHIEGGCTKFKIKFIRDIHSNELIDYYDVSMCQSNFLKFLIYNALYNTSCRMKTFCNYIIRQPELCDPNVDDDSVIEYLQWLCRHTPSPKSTFAAVTLYQLSSIRHNNVYHISADQMQFIRENPDLKLNLKICK
jgi:hypothetical protein